MRIMKTIENFLFIMVVSMGWLLDTTVYGAESKKPCSPGCFCVNNGQISTKYDTQNICGYGGAHRVSCFDPDVSHAFGTGENGKAYDGVVACSRNSSAHATYYFGEFNELFEGKTGMYGFIGDNLIVMPSVFKELNMFAKEGVYQCPSAYPNSASGAKSLLGCYKYDGRGNKIYYKKKSKSSYGSCNIVRVEPAIENLQLSLDGAYSAANVLQNALKTKKGNTDILMKNLLDAVGEANNAEQNLRALLK